MANRITSGNDGQHVEVPHSVDELQKVPEPKIGDEHENVITSIAILLYRLSAKAGSAEANEPLRLFQHDCISLPLQKFERE